jgi:hypothetical protein
LMNLLVGSLAESSPSACQEEKPHCDTGAYYCDLIEFTLL